MNTVMMSKELEGLVDPDNLFGDAEVTRPESDTAWIVQMNEISLSGDLIRAEWGPKGELLRIILQILPKDIQKILEGISVIGVGFRSSKAEKTTQVFLGNFDSITYSLDSIESSLIMTVTIHK